MKDFYIYPTYTPERDKSGNLYLKFFHEAFESKFTITNRKGKLGIVSNLLNLDARTFIYQWIDLIPFKRYGIIQALIFILCISIVKILKRKIILIVHNKETHKIPENILDRFKLKIVDSLMKIITKWSDLIVVHANEGVNFVKSKYPTVAKNKIRYIPHPVYREDIVKSRKVKWDYIIWGGVTKYKNIDSLLEVISNSEILKSRSFLICGKCSDKEYLAKVNSLLSENVTFINEFISDDKLEQYISQARSILFTYKLDSVLSSGALVYSINFARMIIGPNGGSFADMPSMVKCYTNLEELERIEILDTINKESFVEFIDNNKWQDFPQKVMSDFI